MINFYRLFWPAEKSVVHSSLGSDLVGSKLDPLPNPSKHQTQHGPPPKRVPPSFVHFSQKSFFSSKFFFNFYNKANNFV